MSFKTEMGVKRLNEESFVLDDGDGDTLDGWKIPLIEINFDMKYNNHLLWDANIILLCDLFILKYCYK